MKRKPNKYYDEATVTSNPKFERLIELEQQIGELITPNGLNFEAFVINGKTVKSPFGQSAELNEFAKVYVNPIKYLAESLQLEEYEQCAISRDEILAAKERYSKLVPVEILEEFRQLTFEIIFNEENLFSMTPIKRVWKPYKRKKK